MKLRKNYLAVILVVILFGGIGLSNLLGFWSTSSSKVPAVFKDGEFKGQSNPEDIRGSYTFKDLENNFGVPVNILAKAFGIDEENADTFKNKDLETRYSNLDKEIGTGSVRLFVALYKGLPFNFEGEETYLPEAAVKILMDKGTLKEKELEYVKNHQVSLPNLSSNTTNSTTETKETEENAFIVNGQTTFKDLLDKGVKKEDIESIIGAKIPQTSLTVREYCTNSNLPFSQIKAKLQEKLDSIK